MTEWSPTALARQRLTALAMVGAPVLLALGSLLIPADVDSKADSLQATAAQLQVAGVHRSQVFAAFLAHVLGGLLLLPAVGGLLRLARHRGAALATTGGVLAGIGAGFIAADAALFGLTSYFASAPGLDRAALAHYLVAMTADPGAYALFFVSLLFPLGLLLVAAALLHARTVPGWQPWLLLVGAMLGVVSPGGMSAGWNTCPSSPDSPHSPSTCGGTQPPQHRHGRPPPHRQREWPSERMPQKTSAPCVGTACRRGVVTKSDSCPCRPATKEPRHAPILDHPRHRRRHPVVGPHGGHIDRVGNAS
jgi:hypothetical protein